MTALDDRRQRAREAYYDRYSLGDNIGGSARKSAIRECIETATRVQVTDEVLRTACSIYPLMSPGVAAIMLKAAFKAAGFEVEGETAE